MSFPHQKILNGLHFHRNNFKSLNRAKKGKPCGTLPFQYHLSHLKHTTYFLTIVLVPQVPGNATLLFLPGPSFSLMEDIQKSVRAYIIFPCALQAALISLHSMLQVTICSHIYLFLQSASSLRSEFEPCSELVLNKNVFKKSDHSNIINSLNIIDGRYD